MQVDFRHTGLDLTLGVLRWFGGLLGRRDYGQRQRQRCRNEHDEELREHADASCDGFAEVG